MRRNHYFNRDGEEVSAHEALCGGILQNGYSVRVPTIFRDAASRQRFSNGRELFDSGQVAITDGDGTLRTANRPGFRLADCPLNRQAVHDAHAAYLNDLQNAWRNPPAGFGDAEVEEEDGDGDRTECPACEGSGFDENGKTCRRCQGTGEVPDDDDEEAERASDAKRRRRPEPDEDDDGRPPYGSQDRRTVDQIARDHRLNMDRIYQDHAQWLSEQWKTK